MPGNDKEPKKTEPTIDEVLDQFPMPDEHKAVFKNLLTGVAQSIIQTNERLAGMETQITELATRSSEATSKALEGLSAEQVFQIEMAKAQGVSQTAQMKLLETMVASRNPGGGGLEGLAKSADSINALRSILIPPATPLQEAMEKAQIASVISQTRLMNRLTGKTADEYLDKLETDLGGLGKEE